MDDLEKLFLGKVGWNNISAQEGAIIIRKFSKFIDMTDWENKTKQERKEIMSDYIRSVRTARRMSRRMSSS